MCLAAALAFALAAAKLLLVHWSPDTYLEIVTFEVICRAIVTLVYVSGV